MQTVVIGKNQQVLRDVCLPVQGSVLTRVGQFVNQGDLIAESRLPESFEVIDIAAHFRVSPQQAGSFIKRLVGDVIGKGDVLAQKDGFITQLYSYPGDGKVVSLREGRITIALGQQKNQVYAPAPGTVVEILPNRGAVMAFRGSVIEGAWTNGVSAQGDLLFVEDIDKFGFAVTGPSVKDKIIALKKSATAIQLRRLLRLKPTGIVLPGLQSEMISLVAESDVAVMSLLGFGDFSADPLSLALFEVMKDKSAYIIAQKDVDGCELRPVLFNPESEVADLGFFKKETKLEVGAKVRLRGHPYTGIVGVVKELPEAMDVFASGLKSKVAVIECDDSQMIRASLKNIDLIVE